VLLVDDRRPEQRHDAVARELIDRALVPMHSAGEELEATIHDRVDGLGIEALRERAEPHDIGEEHRDLLTLALTPSRRRDRAAGRSAVGPVGCGAVSEGPAGARRTMNTHRPRARREATDEIEFPLIKR
jgi:hypothetical protein